MQPDDDIITASAELRIRCQQAGHALGNKLHDGDRWIAATAIRLDMALASHDGVFANTPELRLITVPDTLEHHRSEPRPAERSVAPGPHAYPSIWVDPR